MTVSPSMNSKCLSIVGRRFFIFIFTYSKKVCIFAVSFHVSKSDLETWSILIMNEIKNKINKK